MSSPLVNKIITEFMANHSGREVKAIYEWNGGYMLVAPQRGMTDTDFSDPYFLMQLDTGKTTQFIPTQNLELFSRFADNQIYGD